MSSANQVIFRLPNQDALRSILESDGQDSFFIQPFVKEVQRSVVRGTISEISFEEAQEAIGKWEPPSLEHPGIDSDYKQLVTDAKVQIEEGLFVKVVPARDKVINSSTSVVELFSKLLEHFPNAFVYIFNVGGKVMLGATPETLLVKENGILRTEALGGTKTNGGYTEKERKEHQLIVSYLEGMLSRLGYVFRKGQLETKIAGPVEHLSTKFELDSRGFENDLLLLEYLHPTPAVCGFPYLPSFNFIKSKESMDRGYYSGYIGPVFSDENFYQFVNLRCAEVYNGKYRLFAGAGVNELSEPELEFQETENKMDTIAKWLKMD